MSVFEIGMLMCFGVAWPVNIYNSLTTKSIEGKSVKFLYMILFGYVFGMTHKFMYNFDFVIYLYLINFLMVAFDIVLYYRNKRVA